MQRLTSVFATFALLFSGWLASASADDDQRPAEPTAEQARHFEIHVRPLLVERCIKCHGPEKQSGSLRVDSLGSLLAGGDTGAAIVPGKADESLLVEAIRYESYEMPPDGQMSDEEIAILTDWIADGAPWPGASGDDTPVIKQERITDEDRQYWAFQPLSDPDVPEHTFPDWGHNAIDAFIADAMAEQNVTPAPEADKRTLIRRLYYDVIGLPPTQQQIEEFVSDERPDAWERQVDRLLASPQYGEKWGRHWLDLVRYAESDGFRQDAYRPHAWRYRDYVVNSLNEDISYRDFVREQLAGDEIAPDDPDALVATGLLRHGIYEYNQRDARTQRQDILNEITDVTGDVFLGMGMACARCHDHKFDPILHDDYFRLQAFFAPMIWRDDVPAATPEQIAQYDRQQQAWKDATADIQSQLDELLQPYVDRAAQRAISKFPADVKAIFDKPRAEWTTEDHQVAYLVERQALLEQEKYLSGSSKLKKEDQEKREALEAELAKFDHLKPAPLPEAMTVRDARPDASPTYILGKERRGAMRPGFPTVLGLPDPEIEPIEELGSSGRRTALADWMTQDDNPITTRVIVNRIWHYHFGQGIVPTTSDFGHLGELPSHPELLDWLVARFIEEGWRFKPLHRLILTSAAYRQSASHPQAYEYAKHDPENRWLWRFPVRRLEAEQIRDTLLAVSERLDPQLGGAPDDGNTNRRAMYIKIIRNNRDSFLNAFDFADGFLSTPERNVTVTPMQSLLLFNGPFTLDLARQTAAGIWNSTPHDPQSLARAAYRKVLSREPSSSELAAATAWLEEGIPEPSADPAHKLETASLRKDLGQAVVLRDSSPLRRLEAVDDPRLPTGDFTIEVCFRLDSLYPDATVRTLVSHWDSHTKHRGWSLGVTSEKSAYQPRNLILQFVGDDEQGQLTYEVVASDLRPQLGRTYYAAVSIRQSVTDDSGITFVLKDLDDPKAAPRIAQRPHQVVGNCRPEFGTRFCVGGRHNTTRHFWHGAIDHVSLTPAALDPTRLAPGRPCQEGTLCWTFEEDAAGPFLHQDPEPLALDVRSTENPTVTGTLQDPLTDLCHVLMNSNELLYVE